MQISELNETAVHWISSYIEAKMTGNRDDIQ